MSNNPISAFADNLFDLISSTCEKKQKTMVEISKEIGISSGALSKYQNGRAVPGIDAFVKIADYFGVSFDYLLGRSSSRIRENIDIASTLGLSDEVIESLKNFHDSDTVPCKQNMKFTNLILENGLYYGICQQLEDYQKERQENDDNPFRNTILKHFDNPEDSLPFIKSDKYTIDDAELEKYMLFKIKESFSELIDEITAPNKKSISQRNDNNAEHHTQDK